MRNSDRLAEERQDLQRYFEALRRNADDALRLARQSDDVLAAALQAQGYARTRDALLWQRERYLRELGRWTQQIADATLLLMAANDRGNHRPPRPRPNETR